MLKRRLLVTVSGMIVWASLAHADDSMPFPAPAIDAASGADGRHHRADLTAGNPDAERNPASLTKLMTGYVVDRAVDQKKITRDDVVTVGKDAWAAGNPVFKGSSLMFLPGDKVTVRDLMRGVIIDSGNDACVALADYVAGSQESFVNMMNSYVQKLGLTHTHFETVHGLDAPGSTPPRAIWRCCRAPSLTVSRISMPCIARKPSASMALPRTTVTACCGTRICVDGMKTGHTESAGFNIVASNIVGRHRLIAVIMGGKSSKGREEQARKLLVWGQNNFDTVQLFHAGKRSAAKTSGTATRTKWTSVPPKISICHCRAAKVERDGEVCDQS